MKPLIEFPVKLLRNKTFMNMIKSDNLPAGFELLSNEESFLGDLTDDGDFLSDGRSEELYHQTELDIVESISSIYQPKPKYWLQRTVHIKAAIGLVFDY
ncbi:hypothetical protein [Calothrix sp. PCC 7507]|uniref:hypothetical protein n=1 Tax=Calothrix sp. PCC 7507 TaxID=99598 RepID=UPI00029EC68B|nr:hypothetical protein [Calothrix sp. PCC 7507]AFY36432.1 hypothetical protein Cal7507_6135 [Calothrix sp. PCC 7507]